jgi:hypothetical protein
MNVFFHIKYCLVHGAGHADGIFRAAKVRYISNNQPFFFTSLSRSAAARDAKL